jgi:hypothetical protein
MQWKRKECYQTHNVNSYYPDTKTIQGHDKKSENYRQISLMNTEIKNLSTIFANGIWQHIDKNYIS